MKNAVLSRMDSKYILLERVTNKKYAKVVFESYLLGDKSAKRINETDYETIFEELPKADILSEVAKYALICSCQDNEELKRTSFVELKERLLAEGIRHDGVIEFLSDNEQLLKRIINDFVDQRYNNKQHIKIDYNINDSNIKEYINCLESKEEIEEKHSIFGMIRNVLFNKSRFDVITDSQYKIKKRNYSLGNSLYASVDKGEKAFYQEDSVLLLNHPDNLEFKMIAVADGDSSRINSGEASNYALNTLLRWFESVSSQYYGNIAGLKELLEVELNKINNRLSNTRCDGATTIAVAIIGESSSLISTIGDSKLLLVKDNKVVYETKDDSYVQRLCDNGLVDSKNAKFHKSIDILMNELGAMSDNDIIQKNTKIIPNNYDKLLILTDGVTRLLNNDKIEYLLGNRKAHQTTSEIVKEAKKEDIISSSVDQYSNEVIKANQNNMTAAMFVKRR